jgi:hypothetical protein
MLLSISREGQSYLCHLQGEADQASSRLIPSQKQVFQSGFEERQRGDVAVQVRLVTVTHSPMQTPLVATLSVGAPVYR